MPSAGVTSRLDERSKESLYGLWTPVGASPGPAPAPAWIELRTERQPSTPPPYLPGRSPSTAGILTVHQQLGDDEGGCVL
jgi:hypothetical protein